jgi:intein-encoded DNA endonuclease-like protein
MKITVRENKNKVKPEFFVDDYFLSYNGKYLRKIEKLEDDTFAVVNPESGVKAMSKTALSAQEVAEIYAKTNGPIEKVKVVEIIVEKTGEILEVEE